MNEQIIGKDATTEMEIDMDKIQEYRNCQTHRGRLAAIWQDDEETFKLIIITDEGEHFMTTPPLNVDDMLVIRKVFADWYAGVTGDSED